MTWMMMIVFVHYMLVPVISFHFTLLWWRIGFCSEEPYGGNEGGPKGSQKVPPSKGDPVSRT